MRSATISFILFTLASFAVGAAIPGEAHEDGYPYQYVPNSSFTLRCSLKWSWVAAAFLSTEA